MARVYPVEGLVVGGAVRVPQQAVHELNAITARYGCTEGQLMGTLVQTLACFPTPPWAVICFEHSYPLAGHIAELRGAKSNMSAISYEQVASGRPPAQPGRVSEVSALVIRKKAILRALAQRSPLLLPAWSMLKDRPHTGQWICVSDPPPAEWAREAAIGDYQRYVWAVIREAEPAPICTDALPESVVTDWASGERLLQSGRAQEALEPLGRVVAAIPGAPTVWNALGHTWFVCGNFPEAIRCSSRALELQPSWANGIYNLAVANAAGGHLEEAAKWLNRYLAIDPFCEHAWRFLADILRQQSAWPKWADAMQHYLDLEPDDKGGWLHLGHGLHAAGRMAQAAEVFKTIAEREPDEGDHWNNLGYCLAKLGRTDEALAACRRALDLNPKMEAAWDSLGYAYLKAGQFEPAVSAFLKAIELCPTHPAAWKHLIQAYSKTGQEDRQKAAQAYYAGIATSSEHGSCSRRTRLGA